MDPGDGRQILSNLFPLSGSIIILIAQMSGISIYSMLRDVSYCIYVQRIVP